MGYFMFVMVFGGRVELRPAILFFFFRGSSRDMVWYGVGFYGRGLRGGNGMIHGFCWWTICEVLSGLLAYTSR